MGCDYDPDEEHDYGGRGKMPPPKEERISTGTIDECVEKKDAFGYSAYAILFGNKHLRVSAPHDPDAAFLAYALRGVRARYCYATEAVGKDDNYALRHYHRFEILEGPLNGRKYDFEERDGKLIAPSPDNHRRYDLETIEGKVLMCAYEQDALCTRFNRRTIDIPFPGIDEKERELPDPTLLAIAMAGERVHYERYKRPDSRMRRRHELFGEPMEEKTQHRLALLTGELAGYEFAWTIGTPIKSMKK